MSKKVLSLFTLPLIVAMVTHILGTNSNKYTLCEQRFMWKLIEKY